jgi:hypothetical protein
MIRGEEEREGDATKEEMREGSCRKRRGAPGSHQRWGGVRERQTRRRLPERRADVPGVQWRCWIPTWVEEDWVGLNSNPPRDKCIFLLDWGRSPGRGFGPSRDTVSALFHVDPSVSKRSPGGGGGVFGLCHRLPEHKYVLFLKLKERYKYISRGGAWR